MYVTLLKLMKERKLTQTALAKSLDMSVKSINERFNDKVEWSRCDMIKIRDTFFQNYTLDDLFQKF